MRGAGFEIADMDVGLLRDLKLRRLARAVDDGALVARCVVAYVAIVLTSWEEGERVTLEDAAPIWLDGGEELVQLLIDHELLDATGRIPDDAWASWFEPASDRREQSRERWRRAAAGRRGRKPQGPPDEGSGGSDGVGSARSPRGVIEEPASHTPTRPVPSVPSVPSDPIRNAPPTSLRDALAEAGGFAAQLVTPDVKRS